MIIAVIIMTIMIHSSPFFSLIKQIGIVRNSIQHVPLDSQGVSSIASALLRGVGSLFPSDVRESLRTKLLEASGSPLLEADAINSSIHEAVAESKEINGLTPTASMIATAGGVDTDLGSAFAIVYIFFLGGGEREECQMDLINLHSTF